MTKLTSFAELHALYILLSRIHAATIGIPQDACYKLLDAHMKELGVVDVGARNIVNIIDGYIGLGYGKSTKRELSENLIMIVYIHFLVVTGDLYFSGLIADVICNTGLTLDPTFTAKAFLGMMTEMRERPTIFQGKRVLFIHTGMLRELAVSVPSFCAANSLTLLLIRLTRIQYLTYMYIKVCMY